VGGVSQPQSTPLKSLSVSLRSLCFSLSLSLKVFLSLSPSGLLGCSARRNNKKKVKVAHLFSNFTRRRTYREQKKRGKRVVSAKRETLEKLLWRRIKIAKGYDGTREIVRIMSREVSSRARRCAFFLGGHKNSFNSLVWNFSFLFLSLSLPLSSSGLVCLSLMTVMMMSRATMDDGVCERELKRDSTGGVGERERERREKNERTRSHLEPNQL